MRIINIRGTSGSGKSTIVHSYLLENEKYKDPVYGTLGPWKKPKIIGYLVSKPGRTPTFVMGRYETACGGCDSLSYKGAHDDMEELVRTYAHEGLNVVYEGLVVSSTIGRWMRLSKEFPTKFVFAYMDTPLEECYNRIVARSGRIPKHTEEGKADFQIKYKSCVHQIELLKEANENVVMLPSNKNGYEKFLELLDAA